MFGYSPDPLTTLTAKRSLEGDMGRRSLNILANLDLIALAFPLVILAVPIFDTAFVIAKRLKYHQPIYQADRWHFHHRMANIGFSQRRTLAYLYGWTLVLAGLALALRLVPYSDDRGHFDLPWTIFMVAVMLAAVGVTIYLVYVLEIIKGPRARNGTDE